MKLEKLVLIAVMSSLLCACADKQADRTEAAEEAAKTSAPPAPPAATPETDPSADRDALIRHMHLHAAHLAKLNAALEAGDLEAAQTPAYWLWQHEAVKGLPAGWVPYLTRIRIEAGAIEEASDVATAKAAAERLAEACQGCHEANGLSVEFSHLQGG